MSNLDLAPTEETCSAAPGPDPARVEVVEPRLVPLGGPRAMTVRRTLPRRGRTMVGAWCFVDHFGPDDVSTGPGMQVPPHPHTGLQTVTWLFAGEVLHRDSVGSVCLVRPGELNLMTAGRGIAHSEQTSNPGADPVLHGVQLWTALPAAHLGTAPTFEHLDDLPVASTSTARLQVFLGRLPAQPALDSPELVSPARTYSDLVGAQLDLGPGVHDLVVESGFEHAILVDAGSLLVDGTPVECGELGYVPVGARHLTLTVRDGPARLVLLGGLPFEEQIVMWWNFIGRSHEDVLRARAAWQAELERDAATTSSGVPGTVRFGAVRGYDGPALPAPELPKVRLRPRPTS